MDTIRRRGLTGLALAACACGATALIAQQPPQPRQPPGGGQGFGGGQRAPFGQGGGFGRGGGFAGQGRAGGGLGAPMPPFGMNPLPEMAKKTAAIMALRVIVESGLSPREIQAALPSLRELRDAEKSFKKRAEQLLDDERTALLSAKPGGPMPPGSGERMQEAMRAFGEKSGQAWESVTRAIGPEKAHMLRQLVDGGFMPGPGIPGAFAPGDGPGDLFVPGAPGGGPVPGAPGGGRGRPRQPRDRGGPPPALDPNDAPALDSGAIQIALDDPQPPSVPGSPGGLAQTPPPGDLPPNAFYPQAPGGQGGARAGRGQGRGQYGGGQGGQRFAPGAGAPPPGQPVPGMTGFFPGPRISVAELVELLEARLAAMPK